MKREHGLEPDRDVLWDELRIQREDLAQAHARARGALERYRALFEAAPVGYLTVDPQGTVLAANDTARELLGETLQRSFQRLLHPDDGPVLAAHLQTVFGEGGHTTCRVRRLDPAGREILLKLDSAPIHPADGAPRARIVLSVAPSEASSAVQLEQASQLLDATEGLFDLDEEGRIRWASASARALLGAPEGALEGGPVTQVLDPGTADEVEQALHAAATSRAALRASGLGRRHDGTRFPADLRLLSSVELGRDGTMLVLRDRSAEQALQRELRQAQRLEALGRIAASVLVDVQNLLSGVWAASDVAVRLVGNRNAARPPLKMIREATQSALDLVTVVLALGRGPASQPRDQPVDDRIREVRPIVQRLAGPSVALRISLGVPCEQVLLEDGVVEHIVLNLVKNACDAMPEGGALAIETRSSPSDLPPTLDPDGPWVELTVRDTGRGIPPQDLGRVFDPFFTTKVPEAADRATPSGLGLSTVRSLVRQAGGEISVDSELGQGARFRVWLPGSGRAPAVTTEVAPAQALSALAPAQVIVVDANPLSLLGTEQALRAAGHRVVGVSSLDEARWAVGLDTTWHAAIVDAEIDADPVVVAAELRGKAPGICILYTSPDPKATVEAGIPVLTRPVDGDLLLATLDAARQPST